jgi:IS5 family transposase
VPLSVDERDSGQNDLFRARFDQIVDLDHVLAKLGRTIDWRSVEDRFDAFYSGKTRRPRLPTQLMAGLDPQTHAQSLRRGVCAVGRDPYQLFWGESFSSQS